MFRSGSLQKRDLCSGTELILFSDKRLHFFLAKVQQIVFSGAVGGYHSTLAVHIVINQQFACTASLQSLRAFYIPSCHWTRAHTVGAVEAR